jgi:hypothetical protein
MPLKTKNYNRLKKSEKELTPKEKKKLQRGKKV